MNEKCNRCLVSYTCSAHTKVHCLRKKTVVVNLRVESHTVYIGRRRQGQQSKFANPYRIGRDGSREQVIAKHKKDFENNPELQEAVWNELRGEVLGCFCKPLACHGDTYIEYIENREGLKDEKVVATDSDIIYKELGNE